MTPLPDAPIAPTTPRITAENIKARIRDSRPLTQIERALLVFAMADRSPGHEGSLTNQQLHQELHRLGQEISTSHARGLALSLRDAGLVQSERGLRVNGRLCNRNSISPKGLEYVESLLAP